MTSSDPELPQLQNPLSLLAPHLTGLNQELPAFHQAVEQLSTGISEAALANVPHLQAQLRSYAEQAQEAQAFMQQPGMEQLRQAVNDALRSHQLAFTPDVLAAMHDVQQHLPAAAAAAREARDLARQLEGQLNTPTIRGYITSVAAEGERVRQLASETAQICAQIEGQGAGAATS